MSTDEAKTLKRGDPLVTTKHSTQVGSSAPRLGTSLEDEQVWLFMSLALDPTDASEKGAHMMRCKCKDADTWRQAFYVRQMERIELQ